MAVCVPEFENLFPMATSKFSQPSTNNLSNTSAVAVSFASSAIRLFYYHFFFRLLNVIFQSLNRK